MMKCCSSAETITLLLITNRSLTNGTIGYRKGQEEELKRLREENKHLRQQVPILEQQIEQLLNEKRHLEVLLAQARGRG